MITGIFLLVILASFPIAIWWEVKDTQKKEKERDAKMERLLEAERLKPKYVIVFVVNETRLSSKPFDPFADYYNSIGRLIIVTSLEIAQKSLKDCYSKGYFEDKDGTTFPVRRVESAWIELEGK